MMSKNSSSGDSKHQQKRTDDSIFATRESLRLVRQQSEGRQTQEVQRMQVR